MKIYKIASSDNGFKGLELKVSKLLNIGWECVGGIAFNVSHCYQAMTCIVEEKKEPVEEKVIKKDMLTANEAMRIVDEIT